jgi:hypothetical protein
MHTKFHSEILIERDYLESIGVYGKIILKLVLKKYGGRVCTRFILLVIRYQCQALVNTAINTQSPEVLD